MAILVTGHGNFATGIMSAIEVIIGESPATMAVDLGSEAPHEFERRLDEAIMQANRSAGVLVCADLPGATPFTCAARMTREHSDIRVIAGANLPMLLEVLTQRGAQSPEELAQLAQTAGRQGIVQWESTTAP